MSQIVDWGLYCSFHNKVDSASFATYEALAEKECKKVIGYRFDDINSDTFGYASLQDCICNVIDKMVTDERTGRNKGLVSVSNDGYSETYIGTNESDLRNDMKSFIRSELSGTGLVRAY